MSPETLVQVQVTERVALLKLDDPLANILSEAMVDALALAVERVLGEPSVKVILLTGEGKMFCAGANIRELGALCDRQTAEAFSRKGQALCDLIETAPKPVIAALNGRYVLGGGAEIAVACHLRLAEECTQFGNPEVQLGLMVGWGGSQRIPRLVGAAKGLELLLTGERVSARDAASMGLVNRVVADGTVLQEAMALARQMAKLSGPVLAATLAAVHTGVRHGCEQGLDAEARLFGLLAENSDWREGTSAFLEKREPEFLDR